MRAHEGAAAEAADGSVEKLSGDARAGAPKAPDKPAEATPRAGRTTATDPYLAIGVAAVVHRNTPPAPLPDDDDATAAYAAAAHARTEQIETVEAIGTVVDALPAEAREGLAAIVEEARAAAPESIAPDGTGEIQLAQAPLVIPPPTIPGATPFGAAPVPVLTPDELDHMGREIEEAVRAAAPHMRPGALGAAGTSLRVLGDLLGVIDPLPADQGDEDKDKNKDKDKDTDKDKDQDATDGASSNETPPRPKEPTPLTPKEPTPLTPKEPVPVGTEDDEPEASPEREAFRAAERLYELATRAWTRDMTVFRRFGIYNVAALRRTVQAIRENPDQVRQLADGRTVSIRLTEENKGLLVVDDKDDDVHGGDVFYSKDIPGDLKDDRLHITPSGRAAAKPVVKKPPRKKIPVSGRSAKEKANDPPSWARGFRPNVGQSGADFAAELMDAKYGKGNYRKGPASQYARIKKWAERAF